MPRTVLVGGPHADAGPTVHIDLDASATAGALPSAWMGVYGAQPFPVRWDSIGASLKSTTANWLRLNPFQSGWVRRSSDGSWAADYAGLDHLFQALASAGINVIVQIAPIEGMPSSERTAIVRGLAQRYGAGTNYSIYRWEFAGKDGADLPEYEAFAQALASIVSERPVGFASTGADPVRDAEAIARLCAEKRCPLSSFSWSVAEKPVDVVRTVRGIRDALSRYPSLKGTMLLPSFTESVSNGNGVSLVQRLLDMCPLEQPHGLQGVLSSLNDSVRSNGRLTSTGRTLRLVNRLQGVRLTVHSDVTAVRCLSSKTAEAIHLLVWREDATGIPQTCTLRIRGLPDPISVRLEQYAEGSDTNVGSDMRRDGEMDGAFDVPDAISDVPAQSGSSDIVMRLKGHAVNLITLRLRPPVALDVSLATARPKWFAGELLDLDCELRNTGRTIQNIDLELLGGPQSPTGYLRSALGPVLPGSIRRVRFRARVASNNAGLAYINVRATGDVRSSLAVSIVPPVSAELARPRYDVDGTGTARVHVILSNMSQLPVVVRTHTADRTGPSPVQATIPPRGRPIEQIVNVIAPSRDAGVYPVSLVVEGAQGKLATVIANIGVPLNCRYASLKPTIDGDLSDWTASEPIGMGRADQVHEKSWHGPTDLSAVAYLRWDEQFLYVACRVNDDVFFQPFSAPDMFKGDSVQFAVSADRRTPGSTASVPAVHEFGMALLDSGHPVIYRFAGPPGSAIGLLMRGAVAAKRVGMRTLYEAAIPWNELNPVRPKEGAVIGFSLRVNDNDGQGRGYITWGGGPTGSAQTQLFPPVKLVR